MPTLVLANLNENSAPWSNDQCHLSKHLGWGLSVVDGIVGEGKIEARRTVMPHECLTPNTVDRVERLDPVLGEQVEILRRQDIAAGQLQTPGRCNLAHD
jgi:hypothetical protein